jgi:hypothetical protein
MKNYFCIFLLSLLNNETISFNLPKAYDQSIGNWKLLYSDNTFLNKITENNMEKPSNNIELNIYPSNNNEKLSVKIKKYESKFSIKYTKLINCNLYMSACDQLDSLDRCLIPTENGENCCLIVLTAEKIIKSVGIFEIPYFTFLYKSGMNPKYVISWKIDLILNRLYVYFDKNTYVFEKDYYDKFANCDKSITANTFIISNIISFIFGKFLESTFYIK